MDYFKSHLYSNLELERSSLLLLLVFEDFKSGRDSCVFCVGRTKLQLESESCGGGVGCL